MLLYLEVNYIVSLHVCCSTCAKFFFLFYMKDVKSSSPFVLVQK